MEDTRVTKRTRQACNPCRRKKTRCPGEKPTCSYCERLSQPCEYNTGDDDATSAAHRDMEERLMSVEGKLDQVLAQLQADATVPQQRPSPIQSPTTTPGLGCAASRIPRSHSHFMTWPSAGDEDAAQQSDAHAAALLYLTWVHRQPIRLFDKSDLERTISSRDPQVVLALQALSLRFPPGSLTPVVQTRLRSMARRSRKLSMERVGEGQVNLATLQALCLLSMVDLADGQTVQAGVQLVLADNLANSVPVDATLGDACEFSNCKDTITLLLNLHGSVLPGTRLSGPAWCGWHASPTAELTREFGLGECMAQISEAWHMARTYAAARVAPDAPPPWHPGSDYSMVTDRYLNIECRVPLKYRFASSCFVDRTHEELQGNRHYWGPWLYMQFVYCAIACLLNHPYLLSLRLRSFRYTLPQTFIHQSYKLLSRQTGWITFFTGLLEEKDFVLSDPTLAHCVAIVATIHLQHSFVPEPNLRERSQAGFQKCLRFLRSMGTMWPYVSTMAANLDKLEKSVIEMPSPGPRTSSEGFRHRFIDASLLQNILIYERSGQLDAAPDRSPFGANLVPAGAAADSSLEGAMVDYNLIGSAGIEGHSSNKAKETPLYPPEYIVSPVQSVGTDVPAQPLVTNGIMSRDTLENARERPVVDQHLGIGFIDREFEGISFQADDFSRAISGWMDIPMF